MGEAASREARAEAPTAKDPDSTKDLPIISTVQNINQPETCDEALPPVCCTPATRCGSFLSSDGPCPRGMSPDDLPSVCRTETGTICGSFLTSTGPCRRFALRGCPLRRDRRYQLLEVSA
jgi:hypothetical protein